MSKVSILKNKVINGKKITKDEALSLVGGPIEELIESANEIRKQFCGNGFDICTIVNAKCGKCSENCKFCAQSSFNDTNTESYPLLSKEELFKQAKYNADRGILRYSIVTSGRRLSKAEVDKICDACKYIKSKVNIELCLSSGLLDYEDFVKLKNSGIVRIHNNLETSRNNFKNICTTHTYQNKIDTIKQAQNAGLSVCSGGIIGMGETMEDRINLAFEIENLNIKSTPINILSPIKGTPVENNKKLSNDEILRTIAIFRFILPNNSIRLAGGRSLLYEFGKEAFQAGANSAISGDMLTTKGISIEKDMKMIKDLGYEVRLHN